MARRGYVECAWPRCTRLTRQRYCEEHLPIVEARRVERRANRLKRWIDQGATPSQRDARRVRSSLRWQKYREGVLGAHPWCWDPLGVHSGPTMATIVHHIKSLSEFPELGFCPENTVPLCENCHNIVERDILNGRRTEHLFDGWKESEAVRSMRT